MASRETPQIVVGLVRGALAAILALALPASGFAQQPRAVSPQVMIGTPVVSPTPSLPPTIPADEAEPALSPEDSAIIDKALTADPFSFTKTPVKPLRLPTWSNSKTLDVSHADHANGSGTVIVKKPLPVEWDAKVGADLGLAANSSSDYDPRKPMQIGREDSGASAAWASLNVPQIATVDARVDPRNDQGRLGTTFKRSLPIGRDFSLSLQSGYSFTETMGAPPAATSNIPLRIVPAGEPTQSKPRVWGNENIAKLDIRTTGTTLAAGLSSTNTDPVTHNTLSAEQKIYGPLGITTTVTDFGRPGESKSVNARFKLTW